LWQQGCRVCGQQPHTPTGSQQHRVSAAMIDQHSSQHESIDLANVLNADHLSSARDARGTSAVGCCRWRSASQQPVHGPVAA
jgi:hypothetical protein